MSDVPQVHTGEPLVPISDDDVAYRAKLPHWTLTQALFLLSGYKPPGYESTRHMQDHFWSAYSQAVLSIEVGDLCRKIERAGEPCFIDRPVRWLAWADSIGPEHIKVDERVRRALSQKAGTTVPTADAPQPPAVRPNRPGREKGSGSYDSKDAPLVKEIRGLVKSKEPVGRWDAALAVADRAPGKGDTESRAKRLLIKYNKKYGGR